MPHPKVRCPQCNTNLKCVDSKVCGACFMANGGSEGGGRKKTPSSLYADSLGINRSLVLGLGGAAKLQALAPEVRRLLLRGLPRHNHKGGLRTKGFETKTRGILRETRLGAK